MHKQIKKRTLTQYLLMTILLAAALPGTADSISNAIRGAQYHPDTKEARRAVGMNDAVTTEFNLIVKEYTDRLNSGIKKIIRNETTKFDSKIRRKNNSLLKTMDKAMLEILSEQQMVGYQRYRATFQEYLILDCEELRC